MEPIIEEEVPIDSPTGSPITSGPLVDLFDKASLDLSMKVEEIVPKSNIHDPPPRAAGLTNGQIGTGTSLTAQDFCQEATGARPKKRQVHLAANSKKSQKVDATRTVGTLQVDWNDNSWTQESDIIINMVDAVSEIA